METADGGVNTINVGEATLLLTSGGGDAVHLTREASQDEPGRAAVPDRYFTSNERRSALKNRGYDLLALKARRWSRKTVCGRHWVGMASNTSEPVGQFGHVEAFIPTCRRCLTLMDKMFPDPQSDSRLPLVVQMITDLILEHGFAEIWDVPGDQQAVLRKRVRSAVRQQVGHGVRTYVHDTMISFVCEQIYEQHAARHQRTAAEAVARLIAGEPPPPDAPNSRRLSWGAWALG
ncbi:MAG TPA: hypothetical protein VKU39_18910 [Streptosporangiaceae bacterium]|nr:hypothetical protein [Streptosporangiaceae bacterium]